MNVLSHNNLLISREPSINEFIEITNHVSNEVMITREGDFVRIWKLDGLAFETADLDDLVIRKEQLNTLLRSIASDHTAIWTHIVRREISDRFKAQFINPRVSSQ